MVGNDKVCSLRIDRGPYSGNARCCVRVGKGLSDEY